MWSRTTVVKLGPEVSMDLAGPTLRLDACGIQREFPRGMLDLLAFYQEAHTLEDGLKFLGRSAKGMEGLAEAFTRLMQLCELGVLVREGGDRPYWSHSLHQGFGSSAQIRMLEDRVRTSSFIKAIRDTVRPDDVVVDVGTGSGILAVAAAQAGAKRVYAIEGRPVAEDAARFFQQAGLSDRIILIRGMSTEITLPERADVLVSETIGNEPLAERILETTCDAVKRLLKPGATLIPSVLRIYATPVIVPEKVRQSTFFTSEVLERWQRWYGVPFRALLDRQDLNATQVSLMRTFVNPWTARYWPLLGPPALLYDFDLTAQSLQPLASEATSCLQREGALGGFLWHFEADLADGVMITTAANRVDRRNCWRMPLWLLPSIRQLNAGRELSLRSGFRNWSPTFQIRIDHR